MKSKLILLLLFACITAFSQNAYYFTVGVIPAIPTPGYLVSFNINLQQNFTLETTFTHNKYYDLTTNDYLTNYTNKFLNDGIILPALSTDNTYSIQFGRKFNKRLPFIRTGVSGGFMILTSEYPGWYYTEHPDYIFGDYTYKMQNNFYFLLLLKSSIEFPFTDNFGLGIDLHAGFSKEKTIAIASANILIGILRPSKQTNPNPENK